MSMSSSSSFLRLHPSRRDPYGSAGAFASPAREPVWPICWAAGVGGPRSTAGPPNGRTANMAAIDAFIAMAHCVGVSQRISPTPRRLLESPEEPGLFLPVFQSSSEGHIEPCSLWALNRTLSTVQEVGRWPADYACRWAFRRLGRLSGAHSGRPEGPQSSAGLGVSSRLWGNTRRGRPPQMRVRPFPAMRDPAVVRREVHET